MEKFAVFIPWADVAVSAERSAPATVVRVRTSAVPSLTLVFHLDDDAADDLFRGVMAPLPGRDPPRRLLRLKPWAGGGLIVAMLLVAGFLASLQLSPVNLVIAGVAASLALWLVLVAVKPFIEQQRKPRKE